MRLQRKESPLICAVQPELGSGILQGKSAIGDFFRRRFLYPVERPRAVVQDGTLLRQRPPTDLGISPRDPGRRPSRSGRGHGRVWRSHHSPPRLLGLGWFQNAVQRKLLTLWRNRLLMEITRDDPQALCGAIIERGCAGYRESAYVTSSNGFILWLRDPAPREGSRPHR